MAKLSLRRPDTQARVCVVVSAVAAAFLLIMAAFMFSADKGFQYFDASDFTMSYGQTRKIIVFATGALALLLAVVGFGMGLNSASHRRNDKPGLSWLGFFIGAGVVCLTIILLFLFRVRGDPVI